MADAKIAEPVVTLLAAVPVPTQGARLRRRRRQSRARLIALLLRVDAAKKRNLRGDGSIATAALAGARDASQASG
jgi:hypothetical protein